MNVYKSLIIAESDLKSDGHAACVIGFELMITPTSQIQQK
jgi:hypothetical protein